MEQRPEIGVYLRDAAPLIKAVKLLQIESSELINPEVALPDRDRVTVYLSNHGSFIAPFPAPVLTAEYLLERGGYDDLVVVSLFHKVAEYVPGLSWSLRRYFGHATQELRSVSGLIELMKAKKFHVIGTTPEASSVLLRYDEPVGTFMKLGLMVAALEADADIVLVAQKGQEKLGLPVELPFGLTMPLRNRPRGLLLPFWHPGRKARITLKYSRYEPLISSGKRSALDDDARRAANRRDFDRIRKELIELYRSI